MENIFKDKWLKVVVTALIIIIILPVSLVAQPVKVRSSVKTSLNAYSFNKAINVEKTMTLFDLLDYSARLNFDAVDLTAYFFPGYPDVPTDEYINQVKKYAFKLGLDISGTGVKNDFANPDAAKRAADVKHVKEWIDVAAKLGAPVIRVFAGPVPGGYENKWNEVAGYMAESLKECAEYGKLKGVLVGVQNHGDFLKTADEAIKIVKMVNSDWFGVIVDTGYFITENPYADIEKIMPYAVNFQIKESPFGPRSPIKTDLTRLLKIINKSGYRGYLPIETLEIKGEPRPVPDIPYNPYRSVPLFLESLEAAIKSEYKN